jgi:ankyrin repeat protein
MGVFMAKNRSLANEIEKGAERGGFDYDSIERLLNDGQDPNGLLWGEPYLFGLAESASEGAEIVARLLLSFGADPDARDVRGMPVLARASQFGSVCMARELMKGRAKVDARDGIGSDAMTYALERVDEEMVSALLSFGYPAHLGKDRYGRPALVCIADQPKGAAVAFELIFRGADPNVADSDGWTPLSMACRAGNEPMASMLISEGADPLGSGPGGLSPLALALGARPGRQSVGGSRVGPSHISCALSLVHELPKDWGWRLDARGLPPLARLYRSIARFELSWMDRLASEGADPRAVDREGWSLLRHAAEAGDQERCRMNLARWAIEHGASAAVACIHGILPEQAAQSSGHYELAEFLRSSRERSELGKDDRGEKGRSGGKRL